MTSESNTAGICPSMTYRCVNCRSHYQNARQKIREVVISSHFQRDAPDFNPEIITDCQHQNSSILHKYEEAIEGNAIYRALSKGRHIVYALDKKNRLILLRAFRSFKEYEKFLNNKKQILEIIQTA
jgi:hypothetical protein